MRRLEAAKQRGISDKWNGVCPPIVPTPVYDGDGVRPSDGMPFGAECKGHWVFTASAKADYPPEVVDRMGNPIINQSEVYSGMYGRVNVTFYPYMFGGKKGIGCGLGIGAEIKGWGSAGRRLYLRSTGVWLPRTDGAATADSSSICSHSSSMYSHRHTHRSRESV